MKLKRLTRDAVLSAAALTVFIIELQLPEVVPIPGVKLGLANIFTLAAMFLFGPWDALAVFLVRTVLGAVFSGNMMALLYSLAGGTLAYLVQLLGRRILTDGQIWVASVFSAMAHNLGQVAAAALVTSTAAVFAYLPVLAVSGIITGLFTGFCAQFTVIRLKKQMK